MSLSATAIKNSKPKDKNYKLFDERGLYLIITTKGSKWWRLDYRFQKKRKTFAMGVYPDVSLKEARERRDQARSQIANDIDPSEVRKTVKNEIHNQSKNSFEVIAREWFIKLSSMWSVSHSSRIIRRFERDVFPWIGSKPAVRRLEHAVHQRLINQECIASKNLASKSMNLTRYCLLVAILGHVQRIGYSG